ncbi:hypothetical protein [Deinococcus petrolearius]|uniref:Uncharacterized protein n=1 Tax=Deinococcus petrolearius TaxID=1751295 RepID=A0ABW1DNW7_9DEIO
MQNDAARERQRQDQRSRERHERRVLDELTPALRDLFGDEATSLTITFQLLYQNGVHRELYTVTVYDHTGGAMWPPGDEDTWLTVAARLTEELGMVLHMRLAPRSHWKK